MSGQLGELVISLAADTARFRADLGKATKATQDASRDMSTHFDKMGSAVKTTIGMMAGLAGVASLGSLVKNSIDAADNMSKMSQKVGVAIDQLSGMAYAASLADVSTEQLGKGMGKLAKLMYEAAGDKNGGPAETFKTLGITVTDAAGKIRDTDDVMMDVADRLSGMKDGAAKTALAMEVFGKAGADLIPLLNGGKKGIQEAADEAKRFGLILNEEAGKQAEEFNDNLTRLGSQASGAAMALVNELAPAVLTLMDGLSKGDGLSTSPLITFITGIGDVVRNTQREAVSMIATFDKMAAWVNTGGSLRHLINKEDAAEYARQIKIINDAAAESVKNIYEPESKPVVAKKKGSGTGSTGKPKTTTVASHMYTREGDLLLKNIEKYATLKKEQYTLLYEQLEAVKEGEQGALNAFNLMASQTGDLKTDRYDATPLSKYRLNTNDQYSIPLQKEADRSAASKQEYTSIMENGNPLLQLDNIRQEQLEAVAKWDDKEVGMAEKKAAALIKIEADYTTAKKLLEKQQMDAAASSLESSMGQISSMLMQGNKRQFEAGKAMAKVMIAIDTARAASAAFAGAAAAGGPWAVAMGVAAGIAAMGVGTMNMARLESVQYEARALGGPVTAGQTYIVNENRSTQGPEYFTPGVSGTITPANKMGGNQTSVTQVLQISAGVSDTVRAELSRLMPLIRQQAVSAMVSAQRNGQM